MEDFAFVRPRPLAAAVMSPKKIFVDASRYISAFWIKERADWYCADNQNTAARTRDRGCIRAILRRETSLLSNRQATAVVPLSR